MSDTRFVLALLSLNIVGLLYISVPYIYRRENTKCLPFQGIAKTEGAIDLITYESNLTTVVSVQQYFMAVLVQSTEKGLDQRNGIRQSWMNGYEEKETKILLKFSIGTAGLSPPENDMLKKEQDDYGDLLIFPNLHNSFSDLTKKVLASFVELCAHYNFSYVLKCDDNTFVALGKVLSELKEKDSGMSLYWGHHVNKSAVQKKGENAEPKWFLCHTYLPFAYGFGYVLSHDLLKKVASNADGIVLYNREDASLGAWIGPYKMERKHDERFRYNLSSINCQNDLVLHSQSIDQMLVRQKSMDKKGNVCVA